MISSKKKKLMRYSRSSTNAMVDNTSRPRLSDSTASKYSNNRQIKSVVEDRTSWQRKNIEKRASYEILPVETRREILAKSFTYESILHDLIVGLETLSIRNHAAGTAHDAYEILACVGARAHETIEEDLIRYINELEDLQGPSSIHRLSAYAHISSDLTGQMETLIFNRHQEKLVQFKKEQEKKDEEVKLKQAILINQIEANRGEVNNLIAANLSLDTELKAAERAGSVLKSGLTKSMAENVQAQQLLVEMRLQGLDFKTEVDKRCKQVIASIEAQMGYVPEAVERQLLQLLNFLPPGDPKYDTARVLGDPRSIKKLRIMDLQEETEADAQKEVEKEVEVRKQLGVEKWRCAVSRDGARKGFLQGKRMPLSNNNTQDEIEKKKKKKKTLSTPLSVSATSKMNIDTNNVLLLLNTSSGSALMNGKKFNANLLEFKKHNKLSDKREGSKKNILRSEGDVGRTATLRIGDGNGSGNGRCTDAIVRKESKDSRSSAHSGMMLKAQGSEKSQGRDKGKRGKEGTKKTSSNGMHEDKSDVNVFDISLESRDSNYGNFRYSVNLLRESIMLGTVSSLGFEGGGRGGYERSVESIEDSVTSRVRGEVGGGRGGGSVGEGDGRGVPSTRYSASSLRDSSMVGYSDAVRDSVIHSHYYNNSNNSNSNKNDSKVISSSCNDNNSTNNSRLDRSLSTGRYSLDDCHTTRNQTQDPSYEGDGGQDDVGYGASDTYLKTIRIQRSGRTEEDWIAWASKGGAKPLVGFFGEDPHGGTGPSDLLGRGYVGEDLVRDYEDVEVSNSDDAAQLSDVLNRDVFDFRKAGYADSGGRNAGEEGVEEREGRVSQSSYTSREREDSSAVQSDSVGWGESSSKPKGGGGGGEQDMRRGGNGGYADTYPSNQKAPDGEEEEEEEEERKKRNISFRSDESSDYQDTDPDLSNYGAPSAALLNSYMQEIYNQGC